MKTLALVAFRCTIALSPSLPCLAAETVNPGTSAPRADALAKNGHCQPARSKLTKDVRALAGMSDAKAPQGVFADWSNENSGNRLTTKGQDLMREFAREKMPEAVRDTKTVFYPFGGPDAIYPAVFFPKMSTLILAGLEEPGALYGVPADAAKDPVFAARVAEIRKAYSEFFPWGYFVTSYMSKDLAEFGTTTMISVGLALMCNEIDEIQAVRLDQDGQAVAAKAGEPKTGVRITYTTPEGSKRTIYYFKQNLSNGNISAAFVKFFEKQKVDTSFFKATMYAPHSTKSFSRINEMARTARYIVQGDSGLPISELEKNHEWKIHLFGQYAPPKEMFKTGTQEELKTVYGNAICQSGEQIDKERFSRIWQSDPCKIAKSPHANTVQYGGSMPFRYDYGGTLPPSAELDFASNLIYAVRKPN